MTAKAPATSTATPPCPRHLIRCTDCGEAAPIWAEALPAADAAVTCPVCRCPRVAIVPDLPPIGLILFPGAPGPWGDLVHQSAIFLAGHCDGARKLDGAGFNRYDADRMAPILTKHVTLWSAGDRSYMARAIAKYHGQLAALNIDISRLSPTTPLMHLVPGPGILTHALTYRMSNGWWSAQLDGAPLQWLTASGPDEGAALRGLGRLLRALGSPGGRLRPVRARSLKDAPSTLWDAANGGPRG